MAQCIDLDQDLSRDYRVEGSDEVRKFTGRCRMSVETAPMLLGPRKDMDDVAEAVRKVQAHTAQLMKERTI
jgi:hypothetical protein